MVDDLVRRPLQETWKWWFALFVPPLAWGARLLAGWSIAEIACDGGWASDLTYYVIQSVALGIALVLVIAAMLAAVSALRDERGELEFDTSDTYPFLAVVALLSGAIFGLLVVVEGSAVYMVSCGG